MQLLETIILGTQKLFQIMIIREHWLSVPLRLLLTLNLTLPRYEKTGSFVVLRRSNDFLS